jgi:hypothetical protein
MRPMLRYVAFDATSGSQCVSMALTERLAALGIRASIGTVADAYDNAMAESTIGLFKTELNRRRGPWRTLDHVEIASLEWVDWFNNQRLHTELGDIPPAEHETNHYRQKARVDDAGPENRASTEPGAVQGARSASRCEGCAGRQARRRVEVRLVRRSPGPRLAASWGACRRVVVDALGGATRCACRKTSRCR